MQFQLQVCQRGDRVTFTRSTDRTVAVILHVLPHYNGSYIENSIRTATADAINPTWGDSRKRIAFRSSAWHTGHVGRFINPSLSPLHVAGTYCSVGYHDEDVTCSANGSGLVYERLCAVVGQAGCVTQQGGSGYVVCERQSSDSNWTYYIWTNETGCPGSAPIVTRGAGTGCTLIPAVGLRVSMDCGGWQPEASSVVSTVATRTTAPATPVCFAFGDRLSSDLRDSAHCTYNASCFLDIMHPFVGRLVSLRLTCDSATAASRWTIEEYTGWCRYDVIHRTEGQGYYSYDPSNSTLYVDCTGNNFNSTSDRCISYSTEVGDSLRETLRCKCNESCPTSSPQTNALYEHFGFTCDRISAASMSFEKVQPIPVYADTSRRRQRHKSVCPVRRVRMVEPDGTGRGTIHLLQCRWLCQR
eukprot:m.1458675 g.1458675  ORF g.1458675 m.1458675 type:complete len:414 (+) comp25123_c0_seq11:864-2105(+)